MDWKETIEPLIDGLTYPSESDEPLTVADFPPEVSRAWPPKSAPEFAKLMGEPKETQAVESTAEKFFAWMEDAEGAPNERIAELRDAFAQLADVRCYRLGEVESEIYLAGEDPAGEVVGLQTLSVES